MDAKKIGRFLKELRKEKGLTQEQLAEILLVSGRSVSRWETGTNMPDLSIMIQIADFYEVEINDILEGERRSESMDQEGKETLSKVAEYSKSEKDKAVRAGNTAFGLMFALSAVLIIVQLIVTKELWTVAGETFALLVGGIAYIGIMLYHGTWENGSGIQSTPAKDALMSIVCSGIFSAAYVFYIFRIGGTASQAVRAAVIFFTGIAILSFAVLRILAFFSSRRLRKREFTDTSKGVKEVLPVKVFTADGTMQADMIIEALKNNGIAAYKQDMGDAGLAAVRYGMGRGINDSVAIFVADREADNAVEVINGMGLL
ncbi:helix-turn-helix domain-containing protein [Lactonifactor longoviformis]|uniref:Transcriptional regulator, contains XRE-family HTH domain n=2 Tax=Lactonifactor TaxID=420345 RepID=A0A1M5AJM1_9CLOT|nr:helix-turn-helix transcriptional regulator [Lactonifactor longoviformis]POP33233.1 helix-turn-helix domain-containing protein [Lactonifactor longoviformis]SHF30324.1 Transcriptional regulator, contains XRE-family HTH domain [Lactonifactor longoviformis DSM 17459]